MLTVISVMCLWAPSQAIVMQYHCFVRLVSHLSYQLCSIAFSLFEESLSRATLYSFAELRCAKGAELRCAILQSRAVILRRSALCNTAEPSCNTPQSRTVTESRFKLCKMAERKLCNGTLPAAELAFVGCLAKALHKQSLAVLFGRAIPYRCL